MSAMEPLCLLLGISPSKLSRKENLFFEALIFVHLCEELKEFFRKRYKNYSYLRKLSIEKENMMLDKYLICLMIKDILATEEYTLEGIARYANIPEDYLKEIFTMQHLLPSAYILRKLMEIHRTLEPDFYQGIAKKLLADIG